MPNEFLPAREPTDNPNPKAKHQWRKTIILWIVLIIMFFALYQLFSAPPSPSSSPELSSKGGGVSWLNIGIPFGLMAFFVLYVRRQLGGGNKFIAAHEPGAVALAQGALDEAERIFTENLKTFRSNPNLLAVLHLDLAHVRICRSDFDGAIEHLRQAEIAPSLIYASDARIHAAMMSAKLFALRGELETSRRWLDDGRRRLQRGSSNRLFLAANARIAETILLAREGKESEALGLLERDLRLIDGGCNVNLARIAWLIRAFLEARSSGPREPAQPTNWVALLRAHHPEELAYLGAAWPEMRGFMQAQGFVS